MDSNIFRITSEQSLNEILDARKSYKNINIVSKEFIDLEIYFLPYIYWINSSVRLTKTYCRNLGFKIN